MCSVHSYICLKGVPNSKNFTHYINRITEAIKNTEIQIGLYMFCSHFAWTVGPMIDAQKYWKSHEFKWNLLKKYKSSKWGMEMHIVFCIILWPFTKIKMIISWILFKEKCCQKNYVKKKNVYCILRFVYINRIQSEGQMKNYFFPYVFAGFYD